MGIIRLSVVRGFPAGRLRGKLAAMKHARLLASTALALIAGETLALAQTPVPAGQLGGIDGSELATQLQERQAKIEQLSADEQAMLRTAQQRASETPEVKAALEARDRALAEFQEAVVAAMVKSDPGVAPILEKMKTGATRGY